MKNSHQSHPCVADLHCDLLAYLQGSHQRTLYDLQARCALPQLLSGGVRFQTMAIYAPTQKGSARIGWEQMAIFTQLNSLSQGVFTPLKNGGQVDSLEAAPGVEKRIGIAYAIENASAVIEESAVLDPALQLLSQSIHAVGRPLYMSLTWNTENRFGGGALTDVGLKADGKVLLEYLHQQRIALDLSHASDKLARQSIEYIEQRNLKVEILASHSNLRCVNEAARNLPKDIAKEIIRRKGLIGLNVIRYFVGKDNSRNLVKHLEKALEWHAEHSICLGADFFYENDGPVEQRKSGEELYFPKFDTAAAYGRLIALWQSELGLSDLVVKKISRANLYAFLRRAL